MAQEQNHGTHRMTRTFNDSATVPAEWELGDVILDLYEVQEIHTGGGLGLVYRVHHRSWNVDLAVTTGFLHAGKIAQFKTHFSG